MLNKNLSFNHCVHPFNYPPYCFPDDYEREIERLRKKQSEVIKKEEIERLRKWLIDRGVSPDDYLKKINFSFKNFERKEKVSVVDIINKIPS